MKVETLTISSQNNAEGFFFDLLDLPIMWEHRTKERVIQIKFKNIDKQKLHFTIEKRLNLRRKIYEES